MTDFSRSNFLIGSEIMTNNPAGFAMECTFYSPQPTGTM